MKKNMFKPLLLLFSFLLIISCSSDDDTPMDNPGNEPVGINNPDQSIDQFIWRGLNSFYLYKDDVNDLANDRFGSDEEFFQFLSKFNAPQETFDGLLSQRTLPINGESIKVDPFSFLIEDFTAFEQSQMGISTSNGLQLGLIRASNSNNVLGYIMLVFPGTSADNAGLKRGMYFNAVNGTKLTVDSNFNAIFSPENYSINLVTYDGTTITELDRTIPLSKAQYTENPIYESKTLDYEGQKIGYLMYNDFRFPFDEQLNEAFGQFKTDGITDLILDLRYNPGGRVSSATILASLIKGSLAGDVFSRELWNAELQAEIEATDPEILINRFVNQTLDGTPLNSIELSRVIVLTSDRTASASELIINGLRPYMDVIQIGETTSGKYQASATLFDSDNFRKDGSNLNENHTFAIQPLIIRSANAEGTTDYAAGLFPDINFRELDAVFAGTDLGQIGDPNEIFLSKALEFITTGTIAATANNKSYSFGSKIDWDSEASLPWFQKMYFDIEKYNDITTTETIK